MTRFQHRFQRRFQHRFQRYLALAAVAAVLAGCKTAPTQPDRNAPVEQKVTLGAIKMPPGVDYARARLI